MKSNLQVLVPILFLAAIFSSCSTSVIITKRHYSSGYYVDISNKSSHADVKKEKNISSISNISSSLEVTSQLQLSEQAAPAFTATVQYKKVKQQNAVASIVTPKAKEVINNRESRAVAKVA